MSDNITILTANGATAVLRTIEVGGVHYNVNASTIEVVPLLPLAARVYDDSWDTNPTFDALATRHTSTAVQNRLGANSAALLICSVTGWGATGAGAQSYIDNTDPTSGVNGLLGELDLWLEVSFDGTTWFNVYGDGPGGFPNAAFTVLSGNPTGGSTDNGDGTFTPTVDFSSLPYVTLGPGSVMPWYRVKYAAVAGSGADLSTDRLTWGLSMSFGANFSTNF